MTEDEAAEHWEALRLVIYSVWDKVRPVPVRCVCGALFGNALPDVKQSIFGPEWIVQPTIFQFVGGKRWYSSSRTASKAKAPTYEYRIVHQIIGSQFDKLRFRCSCGANWDVTLMRFAEEYARVLNGGERSIFLGGGRLG